MFCFTAEFTLLQALNVFEYFVSHLCEVGGKRFKLINDIINGKYNNGTPGCNMYSSKKKSFSQFTLEDCCIFI